MSKAILLVRVSTNRQSFDEQETQLFRMAVSDGFDESDIIPICEKESGIKLQEEERRGLNTMKEVISTEDVSCVYCWEVSRIGRKKKVIFSIVEFLLERHIQLIVKEPYLKLLNADGTINDGAETVLTLYAQLSESEMRNKQARWKRTRQADALNGINYGGAAKPMFGYTVGEGRKFVINEEEAKVIKLIYELYVNSDMGINKLYYEMKDRGYDISQDLISRILKRKAYTGEPVTSYRYNKGKKIEGLTQKLPRIISTEMFDKAQQIKTSANRNKLKGNNYYFARSIMRCSCCGYSFMGYKTMGYYQCLAYKHDNKDIPKCSNPTAININILDSILWYHTKMEYLTDAVANKEENIKKFENDIIVYNQKLVAARDKLSKLDTAFERLIDMYVDGFILKDKMEIKKDSIQEKRIELSRHLSKLEEDIERMTNLKRELEKSDILESIQFADEVINDVSKLPEMYELVHKFIKSVTVSYCDVLGNRTKRVIVENINGETTEYITKYRGEHKRFYVAPSTVYGASEDTKELLKRTGQYYVEIHPQLIIREIGRKKKVKKE